MARPKSLERQLDELAEKLVPRIRRAFKLAITDVRSDVAFQSMIDAIRDGDLEAAFRATGLTPAAMRPITAMIEEAFEQGGVTTAESFRRANAKRLSATGRTVFRFDVRNSRSEAWLREHSSALVTRISDDTRTAIQQLIETGVRDGRNPRSIALDIAGRVNPETGRRSGGIIGLTKEQAQYVTNARRELQTLDANYFTRKMRDMRFDGIVRKAIKAEKPLGVEKINALINRYSDSLLLLRGETIARTEALQSLNRASDDAFRQATKDGTINSAMVTKFWDATGDLRTRPTHLVMDNQAVPMDEPFTTPFGAKMMFPGDSSLGAPASEIINCRCRVRYKVDWLADLDDDPAPTPIKPKVPKPPLPGFAYENFVPLKSVADAEKWALANVSQSTGFVRTAKMDGLNDILRATQEVNERFGLGKVRFVGDPSKDTVPWKWPAKLNAGYGTNQDAFLFKTKATDRDQLTKVESTWDRMAADRAKRVAAESPFIAPEVKNRISQITSIRWAVSTEPKTVAYHELGHRLDALDKDLRDAMKGYNKNEGWHYLVGEYASTSTSEYIAEAFSLYMQGDEHHWRIYPPMLTYLKGKDRKLNGTR